MSWFENPLCEAAALAEVSIQAYAVDLAYPSGHVYLTTWPSDLTISGQVYTGIGKLGSVSDIPDTAQLVANRWTYGMSGVDLTLIPESELDNAYGGSAIEYEVWLNPETHAVIGTEINREGRMGRARRRHGGAVPVIQQDCEGRLVLLEKADGWLWTTQHQEDFFPGGGDTGFNQVREIESKEVIWNGKRVSSGIRTIASRIVSKT